MSTPAEARAATTFRAALRQLHAYPVTPPWPGIKLELMEDNLLDPAHATPEHLALREALAARVAGAAFNRYPDPAAPRVKALLRERFAIDARWSLLLGNGSDELISLVTLATAGSGGTVVAPEPTFSVFRHAALAAGARFVGVNLRADFTLDAEALIETIVREQPKLVWLVYPNNPTGNLFSVEAIERVLAQAPGLVVIDEAYEPFAGGASFLPRLAEFPNLLIMRTLSKIGLAGVRLGYLVGDAAWLGPIDALRGPFNVGVLAQAAAEVLLEHYHVLASHARTMVAGRQRLTEALAELPGVTPFPSQANFVLARFPDAERVFSALKTRGILVRNLSATHPLMHNTLRLSVGTPEEVEALIAALGDILCR
ncbi:MAG: histidinol-phosphate transaminase [Casimicrobiaceae bacterium]